MDIDSPTSDETLPSDSDTSCSDKSDESFEDEENDDTNNNESVAIEPVEQSNDEANKTKEKVNDDIDRDVAKDLSWKGAKLFPPEKNRSNVWKFGGFEKDDKGNLVKEKVICSICGKKISWTGSPTNFRTHLMDKH